MGWLFTLRNKKDFHEAALAQNVDKVKRLVSSGMKVDARDSNGCTALHLAATLGHESVVVVLIASGANVNLKDKDECTPLHRAAAAGQARIAKLLLEAGADKNPKDRKQLTPLSVAKRVSSISTATAHFGGFAGIPITTGAASGLSKIGSGCDDVVALLIAAGAEGATKREEQMLMLAASRGDLATIKRLFAVGVGKNTATWYQGECQIQETFTTALHCAICCNQVEVVQFLVAAGCDLNILGNGGKTPLGLANLFVQKLGRKDDTIVKILRKAGTKD